MSPMIVCNPEPGIAIATVLHIKYCCMEVCVDQQRALKSYSVLSKSASLLEEQEAGDDRDGCLGQGEEEERGLHSSAQLLL